jgi:hypothetical protein
MTGAYYQIVLSCINILTNTHLTSFCADKLCTRTIVACVYINICTHLQSMYQPLLFPQQRRTQSARHADDGHKYTFAVLKHLNVTTGL